MKLLLWRAAAVVLLAVLLQPAGAQTTDATKSIGTPVATITAGVATSFTITAKDESGSLRTSGGDAFNVELEGTRSITGSVVDQLSGQYTVSYTATQSGSYEAAVKLAQAGGLTAAYYENVWFFYTPVVVTVDPQINFNWGTGLITPTGADYISVRWSGKLKTLYAEAYTFYASSDDGVRLWVDNLPLIDRWDSYTNDTSATIALKANVFYAIKMEYKELTGNAYVTLSYSSPSTPKEIVPASQLYFETHAISSPFSTQVVPAPTCAMTSVATGDGLAKATAGTASQFTIQANDEYGNERVVGGNSFSVRCYPPSSEPTRSRALHGVVVDDTDSTYSVEYTPYVSTANTLQVELLKVGGIKVIAHTFASVSPDPFLGLNPDLGDLTAAASNTNGFQDDAIIKVPSSYEIATGSIVSQKRVMLRGFLKPSSDGIATFTLSTHGSANSVTHILIVDGKKFPTDGYIATSYTIVATLDVRSSNYYEILIGVICPQSASSNGASLAVSGAILPTADNTYQGSHVIGSPFAVIVSPARTSAAQSQAYTGSKPTTLIEATAGKISQFTITARDLYTNLRAIGGESFKVRLTGVDSTAGFVYDNGDGTYRVTYTTSKSGTYDISVVFGTSGVIGSPFRIAVEPAFRHLPASIVTGASLTLATAGLYAHVTLTIKDAFDNWQPNPDIMTQAALGFSLMDGTNIVNNVPANAAACAANTNGIATNDCPNFASGSKVAIPTTADKPTLVMHYTVYKSGVYKLSVSSGNKNDGSVKNSPFPLTVFPHIPCASTSTAAGSALSLVTAGLAAEFTIQARDQFYNTRGRHVGDNYAAFLRAPGQASAMDTVYVTSLSDGTITISSGPRGGGAIQASPNDDPGRWTWASKAPFAVGDAVTFSGTLPAPLVEAQVYFVKSVSTVASFKLYDAQMADHLVTAASTSGVTFIAKMYQGLSSTRQNPLLGRDHRATVTDNGDSTYKLQFMPTQSQQNLLHSYLGYKGGLMATYYTNAFGAATNVNTNDHEVLKAPALGTTTVDFSSRTKNRIRINGLIRPSRTGMHSFKISGVDASSAILSVDNMIIAISTGASGGITLSSNSFYDILIDLMLTATVSAAVTLNFQFSFNNDPTLISMETGRMYVAFHTLGSPFAVSVASGLTCSAASTKEGQSISLSTAGQVALFTIQARDQHGLSRSSKVATSGEKAAGWFGNLRDGSGDRFDFALLSGSTVPVTGLSASYYPYQDSSKDEGSVAFQGNVTYSSLKLQPGGYQVQYLATKSGTYQLRGKLMQVGGLYAEYYENNDLTDNGASTAGAFNRIDANINFSWLDGGPASPEELSSFSSPAKVVGADYFSARWIGMVEPQFSEVHTFSLIADDGVKLWVDNLLIINFWSRRNLEAEGTIALMGGQLYTIKIEYTESNGNATCILNWRSVSQSYQVIPSSRLYYSTTSGRLSRTQLYVEPSILCASTSRAVGTGLTIGTAGISSVFTIQAFDEYGNMRKLGDSPDFKVRIVPISDAFQKPYHANLHRWSTAGIQRIPSDGKFPGGLTATYYDKYCLGSADTTLGSCGSKWDKAHSNSVNTYVTCMQRPWELQSDQKWLDSSNSLVLKNANQATCGFGMGSSHSPFISWNNGVEIYAQKMTTDYTSSHNTLREKLFGTSVPFSVRWSGYFQPSLSQEYTFKISTDETASVRLVLNQVNSARQVILVATNTEKTIELISNSMYEIEISYSPDTNVLGAAPTLNLQFIVDGGTFSNIPSSRLFPLAGRYRTDYTATVKGEYSVQVGVAHPGSLDATFYSDMELSTPSATLLHSTVDFSSAPYYDNTRPRNSVDVGFGATSLDDGNSFSARWQGFYLASQRVSTFTVTVGGPDERVRLWIDNRLIIDRWDTYVDVQEFQKSWTATYDVGLPDKTSGQEEALITAEITSGQVSAVVIVNAGVHYSDTPQLETSGCRSSTTVLANLIATIHADGYIDSVTIVSGGSGYICTPSIRIKGGRSFVWSSSANSLLDIKLEYKQLGAAASIKLFETVAGNTVVIPSGKLFQNRELLGSPFPPMTVQPGPTCASKSSVRGYGLTSATTGLASMFTIQSNDQYFNERGVGGDMYLVRLQVGGPNFGCQEIGTCPIVYGTVVDNGDSSYTVTYNVTRRGTYNVVTSLAVQGGLTATYYTSDTFATKMSAGVSGDCQAPDLTLWQPLTGSMIASKNANYGVRLEGFVSPPAETVTFIFQRSSNLGIRKIWFNTHMRLRTESPAAGHGCWLGAPQTSNVYNLPTCTKNYNGPTIATAFGGDNSIVVENLEINQLYDIKIELAGSSNTAIAVQWKYGAVGSVTNAAANIPSSRLWARYDVPNGVVVDTGHASIDQVTFSTETANVPNPWHFYLANTVFVEQTDPASCTVSGDGLTIVTAGWTASFTITAKDSFGNERFLSEDVFLVQLVSPMNNVSTRRAVPDTRPVTHPATETRTTTNYNAGVITVGTIPSGVAAGTPVTFSANLVAIKAGVVYFVERTPVAAVDHTFTVSVYPGGPPITDTGSHVEVTVTFQIARQGAGRYSVAFSVTASGYYSVNVLRGMSSGLTAQYFNNMWLLGTPALTVIDETVNFNWGASAIQPVGGSGSVVLGSDYMSVRWSGYIMPELAETYTFYSSADEGMRLRVNDEVLIDQWDSASSNYSATWSGGSVGALYSISFEYRESTSSAFAYLEYATASISRQIIPQEVLFSKAQHVYGSPFKLYALPAILCATTSTLSGPGLSFGTTGNTASFTIQARDQYSNPKSSWHETCTFTGYSNSNTALLTAVATTGRLLIGSKFIHNSIPYTITTLGPCNAGGTCQYTRAPTSGAIICTQINPCSSSDQDNAFFVSRSRDSTVVTSWSQNGINTDYAKFATISHSNVPGKFNSVFVATKMGASAIHTSYVNLIAAPGLMATYYKESLPRSTQRLTTILQDDLSSDLTKWGSDSNGYAVRYAGIMFATAVGWYSFSLSQGNTCGNSNLKRTLLVNNKIVFSDSCASQNQGYADTTPVLAQSANTMFDVVFTMSVAKSQSAFFPGVVSISAALGSTSGVIGDSHAPVYCEFPVSRSPYNVTVQPDVTNYAVSKITGLALTIATAGVTAQYTITSKDAGGNIRDSDGDAYLVYAASATGASFSGTVSYLSQGLYLVQYTPTVQGAYVLKTYLGTADKTTSLTIFPGSACASLSLANSNYLSVSTAGYISEFSVQCKDSYNNLRTVSVDKWIVKIHGNSSSNFEEQHDARVKVASVNGGSQVYQLGRYNALYRTTKSGAFAINIMLAHTQGLNATYFRDLQYSNIAYNAIEFNSAAFDRSWDLGTPHQQVGVVDNWSVIWRGYLLQNIAANLNFVTFKMIPRSPTDRVRLWIDDRFIIDENDGQNTLSSHGTAPFASLVLNMNMMYDIKVYYSNPFGQAGLKVQWSSGGAFANIPSGNLFAAASHVKGSPFAATVFPALTCGTRSIGSGQGLSLATSGIAASFTITAIDHLGNVRTTSDDIFVVRARANLHNNRQAIDEVTDQTSAFASCAPTITLGGGNSGPVTINAFGGTSSGCKAVTVIVSGDCSSLPKIIPLYTTQGVLHSSVPFRLEHGGFCASTPTVEVSLPADILGTVVPLGAGKYSASYIPTLKRNDAVSFHDLAVSQAVSGGLMATYYIGSSPVSAKQIRSNQIDFKVVTSVSAVTDVYEAVAPTSSRFIGFFRPATTSCTFTLYASTLQAQIVGKLYTNTQTISALVINRLYDIRILLSGAEGRFEADNDCIPSNEKSSRYYALYDLAFNTFMNNGLFATYYTPGATTTATFIQDANLDWSGASKTNRPYPDIPYDIASSGGQFKVRWFGFVQPSRRDRYTFYIEARNPTANSVSLYVDGNLVIAPSSTTGALVEFSGTIQFPKAHDWYSIQMKYAIGAGIDARGYKLSWKNDGYSESAFAGTFVPPSFNETVPKQVIPFTRLTRAISQEFIADTAAAQNSDAAAVLGGISGVSRDDFSTWDSMSPWSLTNGCEGKGDINVVTNDVCFGCLASANITYIDQTRYRKCRGQGYRANDILRVDVNPAIACSSQSVVQAAAACAHCLTVTTAGVSQSFQLTVRDAFGNIRDSTTQAIVSRLKLQSGTDRPFVGGVVFYSGGSGSRQPTLTDPRGRYMVSYTVTRSGTFNNDVSLADVRGNGMYGTYFVNMDLTGGSVTQLDANINFDWGTEAPLPSGVIPANSFSVRWTGLIRPEFSELYTFYALANDAVRVYVDNTLIVDRFNSTPGVEYAGTYLLIGNVIFDIMVEYADFDDAAYITLSYSSPSTPKQVIPNAVLFPALDLLSSSTYGGGRNTLISWPAVTCATTSTVNGNGLTIATAGIPAFFTIQSYDQYSNLRQNQNNNGVASSPSTADCKSADLCNWRVRVVPDSVSSLFRSRIGIVTSHDSTSESRFAVQYTYTIAGAHTVSTNYIKSTQIYSATAPTGAGLAATYYDDILFSMPTVAITAVGYALTGGSVSSGSVPASSGLKNDNLWSARYAGHVVCPASNDLTITVTKTNTASIKIWLDDVMIITDSTNAGPTQNLACVSASIYPIRIEYVTSAVVNAAHTLVIAITDSPQLFSSWDVSGSSKRLRINPAVACSTRSSFLGRGLTLATSGLQALFTVSCRDEFDNLRAIGGDLFVARGFPAIAAASYGNQYAPSPYADIWSAADAIYKTGCVSCPPLIRASVSDRKDNTYIVAFTPTKKGIYKVIASLARVGGLSASYHNSAPGSSTLVGASDYAGTLTVDFSTVQYATATPSGFPQSMSSNFAFVRWQGFVQPSKAAQYTFSVQLRSNAADEVMNLWIDNTRVLSVAGDSAVKTATFGFGMANALYDIHATFTSRAAADSDSGVTLHWESLGSYVASDNVINQVIPSNRLYTRQDVGNTYASNPSGITPPNVPEPRSAVGVTSSAVSASSMALTVHASIGCATKSVSNGDFLTLATAGGIAMFSISGRDSYQNDRTMNSDMPFTVSLYGSGGSPTIQASMTRDSTLGSNIYTSQFTASVALSYDVFVKYANDNAFGSPYSLVVKPAQECATRTTITGSGLTAATVQSQAAFTIQSRDAFGNARSQALSSGCGVTISLSMNDNKLSSCSTSNTVSAGACAGVPVLILGGVAVTPALAFLGSETSPSCNVLNPGEYTANPVSAIPQQSVFVARITYTTNGPIHEIGEVSNAINQNIGKQPMTMNSFASYDVNTNPLGMMRSSGIYQGIYTLTSAPESKASYFIPSMGVKNTLVATYYSGSVAATDDIDSVATACFSGMIPFAMPSPYAALGDCGTTPKAARFAGLVQTAANTALTISVTRTGTSIVRIFFRGKQLVGTLSAGTGDTVTGVTSGSFNNDQPPSTSYSATNLNAFDDFFVEVVGDGKSVITLSSGTVWGNNYLSQPVFSQTVTI